MDYVLDVVEGKKIEPSPKNDVHELCFYDAFWLDHMVPHLIHDMSQELKLPLEGDMKKASDGIISDMKENYPLLEKATHQSLYEYAERGYVKRGLFR
jgi:hypothetical protein